MTADRRIIAAHRFGTGLSPRVPTPQDAEALLRAVTGPDPVAKRFPVAATEALAQDLLAFNEARREMRQSASMDRDRLRALRRPLFRAAETGLMSTLARGAATPDPLRERLTLFWADHFAVRPRNPVSAALPSAFMEEAIRPNILAPFAELLKAAVTHPAQLISLDQVASIGPNSPVGLRRERGLNENLAREVLELHTLGVGGPYTQEDVRQFAELLTGLSYSPKAGPRFRPRWAEPGAETVLGRSYGGDDADLASIHAALEDLAHHPATARHLATKLATHFVSDTPDAGLVQHLETRFLDTEGDLSAVTEALLEHPAAWAPGLVKARRPLDFMQAALRALAPDPDRVAALKPGQRRRLFHGALQSMGQTFWNPPGPDGWPEPVAAWIHPQGLASRIQWAMTAPQRLLAELPDPRVFVSDALGEAAPPELVFAAAGAETRAEGVGLVLSSPIFNRR